MKIVAAALRVDGLTIIVPRPGRHHHIINGLDRRLGIIGPDHQGFITDDGTFVDRALAYAIADAAGQIVEKHGRNNELYSEDLW